MASLESTAPQRLELNSLPPELRDLVWSFTLPDYRIFHVKEVSRQEAHSDTTKREMCFHFHIRHALPVALQTCRESRTVALREGFFLSPHGDDPGVWFRPATDILYFDRNQRTTFQVKPGQPRVTVPGWDRVLNVGIEWRAFFRDTPRPSRNETTASYWRAAIEPLYAYMPRIRTVNYILPKMRHKGGMMWGREPYHAERYEAVLVPLPESVQIPWETTRNRGQDRAALLNNILFNVSTSGLGPAMRTWEELKCEIEKGFEEELSGEGHAEHNPPEIIGWWLLRDGIPTIHENPQIQIFDS
ncbi:hypothetical protein NW762_003699 [Fusarium torreyae]|uniref:2EXR domain-containing protein n=1 Tax=Fusarium torreyae TaxID=1237075 RepID=A0A9W8VLA4_9HYPO|nr:hypothetical protein NW762_003699 [Fusarium torreyae]